MLRTVLNLDRSLPRGDVSATRREIDLDNVWQGKLLQRFGAFCLEDVDASGHSVCEQPPVWAILVRASRDLWACEVIEGII